MPRLKLATAAILLACLSLPLPAEPIYRPNHIVRPVTGNNGAVSGPEGLATEAGLQVLREGGNAVDAAVTIGFAIAVTLPRAGNIGGGGFMVFFEAASGQSFALDFREMAPSAAHRDMFLNEQGEADADLSQKSPLAVGVPGTVAGLLEAHRRFGTMPLDRLMAPAIALARDGYLITDHFEDLLTKAAGDNGPDATAREVFHGPDGNPRKAGERLLQADLAASLERIAREGRNGFYTGPTARAIVETLADNGGLISMEDMAAYRPVWRDPVTGNYKGHTVVSMPPPSSGGVHLIQMLNLLENFPLEAWGQNSAQAVHIMAEVMKRAYADRSKYLGDPDFVEVPVDDLPSEAYEKAKPGVPNAYGLLGGEFNAVEAGKRPLSSMTPTIVLKDGQVRLVTGSPGGSRIITAVLQVILNVIEFNMTVAEAVYAPRFHHQWFPDKLFYERTFPSDTLRMLRSMGYPMEQNMTIGSVQSVYRDDDGQLQATADPRRQGSTALAY